MRPKRASNASELPQAGEGAGLVVCARCDCHADELLEVLAEHYPHRIDLAECGQTHPPRQNLDGLAVVAVDGGVSGHDCLVAIRSLRSAGYSIIANGDSADAWPIEWRARALLAGADIVLDRCRTDFRTELRTRVETWSQERRARAEARSCLKRTMQDLGLVGGGPAMLALFQAVVRVGRLSDVPVLLEGETGTGKELVARALHTLDPKRHTGPFLALNCAALSTGLAESELFGFRRGAFTGADRDRRGLFRGAEGGVLFLDEIGELDLGLQAKLLRVLQERRVLVLGEDHEQPIDVRIIAATNRTLAVLVDTNRFRADLYHRLNVITLALPPLRARREDLPTLVAHFVAKHRVLALSGCAGIGADFLQALAGVELPGNVRQLENLVRRALVAKTDPGPLGLRDLPVEIWSELADGVDNDDAEPAPEPEPLEGDPAGLARHLLVLCRTRHWNLARLLEEIERLVLDAGLKEAHGSCTELGTLLGLKARTLYNKRHKYRLCG